MSCYCRHSKGGCQTCPDHPPPPFEERKRSEHSCCCGSVQLEDPLAKWTDERDREIVKLIRSFDSRNGRGYEFHLELRAFLDGEAKRLGVERPEWEIEF